MKCANVLGKINHNENEIFFFSCIVGRSICHIM